MAEGRTGLLRIYVFDDESGGGPLPGAMVEAVGAGAQQTDASGRALLELPAGVWTVRVTAPAGRPRGVVEQPEVRVVGGASTELIIALRAGAASVDVEAPDVEHEVLPRPETQAIENTSVAVGTLEGHCFDPGGQGVVGVQVFVRGQQISATTDARGHFFLKLPVGLHDLSFIHPGYAAAREDAVSLQADQTTTVEIALTPASLALEEFVVTAPYIEGGVAALTAERRKTGNVVDVIGAEQMARSGDSSAAAALRRVTGLTIVGGRYVYVRGMGERYSNTLLNGITLPSPEPERRVVPLDMFPTGVLSSVLIQKTWSADVPGEFGGGVLKLRTRRMPEAPFLKFSGSLGHRQGTTFEEGLTYDGGALDFLGVDDGTRAMPDKVRRAVDAHGLRSCTAVFRENCITPEERQALGRAMPEGWSTDTRLVPPDVGFTVSGGQAWEVGEIKLGGVASVSYSQSWQREIRRVQRTFDLSGGELTPGDDGAGESLARNIQSSAVLDLGADLGPNHRLATTTLLLRDTEDETSMFQGDLESERSEVDVRRLRWVERQLLTQQFRGDHTLPIEGLDLRWHYGFAKADRSEPNRRIYQYDRGIGSADPLGLSPKPEGNRRFFSALDDTTHDLLARVRWAFGEQPEPGSDPVEFIEAGARRVTRERAVQSRRFRFVGPTGPAFDQNIDEIFVADNIGPDQLSEYRLENTTQATDDYQAEQRIEAVYAQGQVNLLKPLRLLAGLRLEKGSQSVSTFSPFAGDDPVGADLNNTDLLPAAALTWAFVESMQLRMGYSRTVNRPEFRELSPARFDDVTNRVSVVGNPEVQRTLIDHYDLRWEWYWSARESLSVAVFYKDFERPIETRINPGADQTRTFFNAPGGTNLGVELELRKSLDVLGEAWSSYYIAGNVAFIDSEVDLSGDDGLQTSKRRALQGQSPYVVNAQLGYEDLDGGAFWTLLYNVSGRRIADVGTVGRPDIFEEPRHVVDVVGGYTLKSGVSLTLKGQDLLNNAVIRRQGAGVQRDFSLGRRLSVGAGISF